MGRVGIVGAALVASCAGYTIEKGGSMVGYDVYAPEPYLAEVVEDGKTGFKVIWLPNYRERYRISTYNFLAKADFSFEIKDGWMLTKIEDKSNNADVATKLVDLIPKPAAIKGADPVAPKIYRMIFEKGILKQLEQVGTIPLK